MGFQHNQNFAREMGKKSGELRRTKFVQYAWARQAMIYRFYEKGISAQELSAKHKVPLRTIYRIIHDYKTKMDQTKPTV